MTGTAETRPEISKIKKLLETTETKILRGIAGKTLIDKSKRFYIDQFIEILAKRSVRRPKQLGHNDDDEELERDIPFSLTNGIYRLDEHSGNAMK
ncbi:hypothetical protein M0802_009145 [Mischocyttarus mexicanus]|nr:hypothetical protein M0802_009145 [Mischocyttarus mexicanus]